MHIETIRFLYHGSGVWFDEVDLSYAKGFKDFGAGFYLTSDFNQAQKWAQKKAKSNGRAYIYQYKFNSEMIQKLNILELLTYDKLWLDYITINRMENKQDSYDIVYDKMADNQYDVLTEAINNYYFNRISSEKVIEKIRWKSNGNNQYCFKSVLSLTALERTQTIVQVREKNGSWVQERN